VNQTTRCDADTATNEGEKSMTTLHDFEVKTIDGHAQSLGAYAGKVVLVVNVASACGFTPQYAGLEKLHEELGTKGLVVAGFPSNDFGAQEPGTDDQIKEFCATKFAVKFPLFSKIPVKGANKHPLYAFLTSAEPAGEVKWNFEKFLVGKDGKVIARYSSKVEPGSPALNEAIEAALAQTTI
jgi:glutathione peroxidase